MDKMSDTDKAKKQEDDLEEGLEETFPGSDPAAATQPGDGGPDDKGKRDKDKKDETAA